MLQKKEMQRNQFRLLGKSVYVHKVMSRIAAKFDNEPDLINYLLFGLKNKNEQ